MGITQHYRPNWRGASCTKLQSEITIFSIPMFSSLCEYIACLISFHAHWAAPPRDLEDGDSGGTSAGAPETQCALNHTFVTSQIQIPSHIESQFFRV